MTKAITTGPQMPMLRMNAEVKMFAPGTVEGVGDGKVCDANACRMPAVIGGLQARAAPPAARGAPPSRRALPRHLSEVQPPRSDPIDARCGRPRYPRPAPGARCVRRCAPP